MQKAFFLLILVLSATVVFAQQSMLQGYVKDSLTHLPLAGATVSNPQQKKKVQTDSRGAFSIPALPNELVYILAPNFSYDTLRYSMLFRDTITIYLAPVNVLQAVTVEGSYQRYQKDSAERRLAFEKSLGHVLKAVDPSQHKDYFGLTVNLDRFFKKKYRTKRGDLKSFEVMERQAYIHTRFSPQFVAFYTGLRGGELSRFMQLYTPSYEWLRQHLAKEQLLDYLSEKLVEYRREHL